MTYRKVKLDIDDRIYPQLIAFLRLLPVEQCMIEEEETKITAITAHQKFIALAGSWEGEELQRAPQEEAIPRLEFK